MVEFERSVAGISALAEPVRRELYRYVCAQPAPVGRDAAADAIGIPRHQAKFHLDRLEAEGLLEVEYARLTARTGPGAGRPAKLYRRAATEIAVTLPQRDYERAARLMADAIAQAAQTNDPVLDALHRSATAYGVSIGQASAGDRRRPRDWDEALALASTSLTPNGYEPRRDGDRMILANCPFHALAQTHRELVCAMNHSLLAALVDAIAADHIVARLEPGENRCCVVLVRSTSTT